MLFIGNTQEAYSLYHNVWRQSIKLYRNNNHECQQAIVIGGGGVCLDHKSRYQQQHSQHRSTRFCDESSSNIKKSVRHLPNKVYYELHCSDTDIICDHVNNTVNAATEIISSIIQLETPLYVNISYFSFCDLYEECTINNDEVSIGQAYPSVSYLMTDGSDNMTRMYPQATLKQFTHLKPKPQWLEFDIIAEFNGDNNWYFVDDSSAISSDQSDLLRTILHELVHGLGFISSWSDDLYQRFQPYVDGLIPFLTPMLLTPPKQLESIMQNENTDEGNQPFWGFVELPMDKYLKYHSVPLSTITNILNNWGNANILYNSIYDMVNAWVDSNLSVYAQSVYYGSITIQDILLVFPNSNNTVTMETSLVPFTDGSTLSHVDYSSYHNSADYLMTYTTKPGVSIASMNQAFSTGPLGPNLLQSLSSLGYRIHSQSSSSTIRPPLTYWNPPSGLVGTTDNPSASASIVPSGPARPPPSSSSSTAPSHSSSTASSHLGLFGYFIKSHPFLTSILLVIWSRIVFL
ncbi:uncharacterized protein BX664DRAFT_355361 [Halteromyces radiatus]|uniref:uncharacterized protein n=1 Tax=Halteromyces radiatus TaxID=101107 RepID=UPI00221F6315|nr:uncharacterized protein BX664DRAFT_355361 [Halteromyces radiatus]KAI8099997.1 hypothetical protein BX664DRAFT_355361 [Halteromyces radiatus]